MSKLTNRKLTALLLALGLLSVSSASDAGLIRMAGSTTATAPARTGSTALVSDTVQLNDLFPTVSADLLVHDGDAPDVQVVFAGSSQCDWAHEDCWGEYVPGEHVILEGAIYGGNTQTANLTFEFSIKDMTTFATVLQYTEASSETSIGTFYSDYTTPGNPCVGVHFYAVDSGACQAFLSTSRFQLVWQPILSTTPSGMPSGTRLLECTMCLPTLKVAVRLSKIFSPMWKAGHITCA